jgi:hypothetical protein
MTRPLTAGKGSPWVHDNSCIGALEVKLVESAGANESTLLACPDSSLKLAFTLNGWTLNATVNALANSIISIVTTTIFLSIFPFSFLLSWRR